MTAAVIAMSITRAGTDKILVNIMLADALQRPSANPL
jgi:hypothetical protein